MVCHATAGPWDVEVFVEPLMSRHGTDDVSKGEERGRYKMSFVGGADVYE